MVCLIEREREEENGLNIDYSILMLDNGCPGSGARLRVKATGTIHPMDGGPDCPLPDVTPTNPVERTKKSSQCLKELRVTIPDSEGRPGSLLPTSTPLAKSLSIFVGDLSQL